MPRNTVPKYRKQPRAGKPALAFVELAGSRVYLGEFGTAESRTRYAQTIAEWEARGRQPAVEPEEITVSELTVRFWAWAESYYVKPTGEKTHEIASYRLALRPLTDLYGDTPAAEFGPGRLKVVRQQMIEIGWARPTVNRQVGRLRRMFKWAASEELVSPNVYLGLGTVAGLKRGRTEAYEPEPVRPVSDALVDATLPHMTEVLRGMVTIQRLTGMRPGEVVQMRTADLDMSGSVWTYTPRAHKTQHHGRARVIYIGPRGQEALRSFLRRNLKEYLFRPVESESERLADRHAARVTPMSCGNRPGSNRVGRPKRSPADHYTTDTYRKAITYTCDRAFPAPEGVHGEKLTVWRREHRWSPNQLRHTFASQIRREHGLEAAQVLLGHAKADVTQVYAERDCAKASDVIVQVG